MSIGALNPMQFGRIGLPAGMGGSGDGGGMGMGGGIGGGMSGGGEGGAMPSIPGGLMGTGGMGAISHMDTSSIDEGAHPSNAMLQA